MQTEQLLCWSGMTDTAHITTSGSNEEEETLVYVKCIEFTLKHSVNGVVKPTSLL